MTLRDKILGIALVVMLTVVTVVITTSTFHSYRQYEDALQSRSMAIGKSLAIQFERLLQLGLNVSDIIGFEEQCQEVVEHYPGIDVAMVVDRDSLILFHNDRTMMGRRYDVDFAGLSGKEEFVEVSEDGGIRNCAVILVGTPQQEQIARIVISYPPEFVGAKLKQMLMVDIGVALLVMLMGLSALYFALKRHVIRPLGALTGTVAKLRETPNDLTRRAYARDRDELGQLATAFNGLMDELQQTTVSKAELEDVLQELQRISDELFVQKERLEVTLNSVEDAVISADSGMLVTYLNPSAERILACSAHIAIGRPVHDFVRLIHVSTGEFLPLSFEEVFGTGATDVDDSDLELLRDGSNIAVTYTAAPMHTSEGQLMGGVLTLRDVTAERRMAQRLSWEATHDHLTGLINRREFAVRLENAVLVSKSSHLTHAVCFMDLDRFKIINDSAGHAAGDEFLKSMTQLFRSRIRATDHLARLGGDEFALLLEGCPSERARAVLDDLIAAVDDFRFEFNGKIFTAGISIGLVMVNGEYDCDEILHMADTACYHAKEQGGNRVSVFQIGDRELTTRRLELSWVERINSALREDEFILYQQTYLALNPEKGQRRHMEVLLRMLDENGEPITPGRFLPAAERHNLMPQIDRMVIRKVISGYHELAAREPGRPLTCSINLSGASLNSGDLYPFVEELIRKYDLPPAAICFEITETTAINNLRNASAFIAKCKTQGIMFALDDFGTGTSSFGYLKKLQVDMLKIDGEFVRNMALDAIDRAMTETMNHIGKLMGLQTVAEYAENETIIRLLRSMGVDFAQGYGVCMPKPLFESEGK